MYLGTEEPLTLHTQNIGYFKIIEFVGPLNMKYLQDLLDLVDELLLEDHYDVVFDLSRVNQITSYAIRFLINAFRLLKLKKCRVFVLNPSDDIMEVLEIFKMNRLVPFLAHERELRDMIKKEFVKHDDMFVK